MNEWLDINLSYIQYICRYIDEQYYMICGRYTTNTNKKYVDH